MDFVSSRDDRKAELSFLRKEGVGSGKVRDGGISKKEVLKELRMKTSKSAWLDSNADDSLKMERKRLNG